MPAERQHGAFVYTGSGRKQATDAPLEQTLCKEKACAIQYCLSKNGYQEARCKEVIREWRECAESARALEAEAKG